MVINKTPNRLEILLDALNTTTVALSNLRATKNPGINRLTSLSAQLKAIKEKIQQFGQRYEIVMVEVTCHSENHSQFNVYMADVSEEDAKCWVTGMIRKDKGWGDNDFSLKTFPIPTGIHYPKK